MRMDSFLLSTQKGFPTLGVLEHIIDKFNNFLEELDAAFELIDDSIGFGLESVRSDIIDNAGDIEDIEHRLDELGEEVNFLKKAVKALEEKG
jgi:hypothetical protein